jgi:hypothetical protein
MPAFLNPKPSLAAQVAALWQRIAPRGPTRPVWSRLGLQLGKSRSVTAVMVGARCAVVRLEARADGLHLVAADEGEAGDLARWKPLFKGSRGVLVLRSEERFLQTLDKPEVPEAELNLAVRWPMGEALGTEPEQLLTMALPLPRVNEAVRAQVLGVATRLETAQGQLASLRQVGLDVRSIDVIDSALRGMALLQEPLPASAVVVCLVGNNMSIGLIQHGQICALRSVPLPEREGHADADLAEQLALNTRRTYDHYERQAMLSHRAADNPAAPMAVGRALASVGSLSQAALDTFCTALPDAPQLFEVGQGLHCTEDIALRCAGNDELTALACVAAARLFDTGPVARRTATAQSTTSATNPATATASATAAATPAAAAPPPATAATPIATNALAWTVSAAPAPPAADADRAARAEEAIP